MAAWWKKTSPKPLCPEHGPSIYLEVTFKLQSSASSSLTPPMLHGSPHPSLWLKGSTSLLSLPHCYKGHLHPGCMTLGWLSCFLVWFPVSKGVQGCVTPPTSEDSCVSANRYRHRAVPSATKSFPTGPAHSPMGRCSKMYPFLPNVHPPHTNTASSGGPVHGLWSQTAWVQRSALPPQALDRSPPSLNTSSATWGMGGCHPITKEGPAGCVTWHESFHPCGASVY